MKTKKKLLIPVAMLVLAVMAVTSATFAWFTTNSTVSATISKAQVVSDGTMLFVVDQTKYSAAENVLWQAAYDDYVTNSLSGVVPTPGSVGDIAASAAADAAIDADAVNSILDDTLNWSFSTQFSYENSDLEMLDLTYTRDNDQDRFVINAAKNPYAGALQILAPDDYFTEYNDVYGNDVAGDLIVNGTIVRDVTGTITTNPYEGAYAAEYVLADKAVWDRAYADSMAEYLADNPGSTDTDPLAIAAARADASAAVNDAANILKIAKTAAENADDTATAAAILAVEATVNANDDEWDDEYNTAYGNYTAADEALTPANVAGTLKPYPYDGFYAVEYTRVIMALTGVNTNLADAQAAAGSAKIRNAQAAAAAFAKTEATKVADAALLGKATTLKIETAVADSAYSHYGIDDGLSLNHTLYNKSIFNATNASMVTSATARANKDYIDLTYTFWCAKPADLVTNKLALDIGGDALNPLSYITSPGKSIDFNGLDRAYFLAQGPADERVAQFYGTATTGPADPDAGIIQSNDGLFYEFDDNGTYDSSAAFASRVMFTNIAQGAGSDEIIGVWEPNATKGYDKVDGSGNRIETLDVQDMYNKAQAPVLFDDITPISYVNRYDSNTTPNLLIPSNDNDIELIRFTDDYTDATDAYYRAQINVKIWLEGFDSDCFNVILGDALNIGLQFKAYAGV